MNKPTPPLVTPRLFAIVVGVAVALLVIVVIVGLVENQLDPTSVAYVLTTLISGIVVGAIVRGKQGGD